MPLVAPSPRRERILMFAPDKTAKSTSWLTIASYTTVDFWIADSDMGYWANVEEFPSIDQSRMHLHDNLLSWADYLNWADEALANAKPDDWFIMDRVDAAREAAKNHYLETVYGQQAAAWYLDKAVSIQEANERIADDKDKKAIIPTLGANEWAIINTMYYTFLNRLNVRARQQHIFMCSTAKEIETKGMYAEKDKRVTGTFGELGMKPDGGPGLAAIPNTILYVQKWGAERRIRTIGDRGRERKHRLDDALYKDFVTSYLIPVAKWKVE